MWFRHKMSQLLMAQRDILLAECEEYALCHGDQIRKTKFQSELSKKAKSLVGQGWYGAAVEPREHSMMKEKKDIWVGKDQQKRFQQEQLKMDQKEMENIIHDELKLGDNFVPTKRKLFSNSDRVALVKTISEAHNVKISCMGRSMDIFFSSKKVLNKSCAKFLLRMITIMPQDYHFIKVLQESMVNYASLYADEGLTIRKVEWRWAFLGLDIIRSIRKVSHLVSPSLKTIFGSIIREHGYKYTCNNPKIAKQLSFWMGELEHRKARLERPLDVPTVSSFLEKQMGMVKKDMLRQQERDSNRDNEPPTLEDLLLPKEGELPLSHNLSDIVIDVDDRYVMETDSGVKIKTPVKLKLSPVKVKRSARPGSSRTTWTDGMKRDLLRLFLYYSPDLISRDPALDGDKKGSGPRKIARKLVKYIWEDKNIMVKGEQKKLREYPLDTLAIIMTQNGLSGQVKNAGLLRVIDKCVLGVEEELTTDLVRQHKKEIMALAEDLSNPLV